MKKILLRTLLASLVVVAGVTVWALWPEDPGVEGIAPPDGRYDAVIRRDSWGVPHVHGATDADAAYGLAWAHAEDDFATIQDTILGISGQAAAHLGQGAAGIDYLVGLLRIREDAEAGWESLAPETRELCEAYAAGINHYASLHPDQAIPGLWPVTGQDIVAGFLLKAPLFFGLDQVLGDLITSEERPDLEVSSGPAARFGSNVLAVSPERSADGSTFLAVNSHQPWSGPVAWYEAHVTSDDGWDMTGGLFPGMPVLALGHNRDLGWSFTVNRPDLIDVFVLETDPDDPNRYRVDGEWLELDVRQIPIRVQLLGRLRINVEQEALWSIYGPTIRTPHGTYAVRYAGMGLPGMVEQLHRMNKAAEFEEWRAALEAQSGLASLNIGYADRTGRIALVHHGLFPERADDRDWLGYIPGDTRDVLWNAYLPLDELPWVVDPEAGYIQNANSTPYSAAGEGSLDPRDFPSSMGIPDYETNRSLRALELLESDSSIDWDVFREIKYDQAYHPDSVAVRLAEMIVGLDAGDDPDVAEAIGVVSGWDRTADPDDPATALVITTLALLVDGGAEIDPSQLVQAETPPTADVAEVFPEAVRLLTANHGQVDPAWRRVNRIVRGEVDEGMGGGPDLLHAVYGLNTEGRFEGVAGDSYVLLVRWDPQGELESWSIHQYGSATSDPDSPHYADQVPLFAAEELKPVWFDETDVAANTSAEYRPGEGR